MNVLLVEDTASMRMAMSRALRRLDAVDGIVEADSAEGAIDLLESEPVDLILCDWWLGGISGIEFLEALRAAQWSVPFGFVTAEFSEESRSRALEAGAAFLLTKPFNEHELAEALAALGELPGPTALSTISDERAGDEDAASPERLRADDLSRLLAKLCDNAVEVQPSAEGPDRLDARYVATYENEEHECSGMCAMSTPLVLGASAAMRRFSPQTASEWASTGIVPDELAEECSEIASVLAQFVSDDHRRLVLSSVEGCAPGERFTVNRRAVAPDSLEHFTVEVADYGSGLLTVARLEPLSAPTSR